MTDDDSLSAQTAATIVQINAILSGSERGLISATAYETIAQAVVLGRSRISKQQACILRNALTAAAASAILRRET